MVEKRVILFFNSHTKVVGARRQIGCIVNLGSACRSADEMFIFNFRHFPAAAAAGLGCETTTLSMANLVFFFNIDSTVTLKKLLLQNMF